MFIEQNATLSSNPFGRAEVDEILATQVQSARPNGAGGSRLMVYKHVTPDGVKPLPVHLTMKLECSVAGLSRKEHAVWFPYSFFIDCHSRVWFL
jgi:hypothetical protein